tara:strand:- start:7663 stop:7968 length:306 start_codon:yes stop_codon:yes gene_type:complete
MLLLLSNQLSARINIQQNKKPAIEAGFFIVCFTPNRSRVNNHLFVTTASSSRLDACLARNEATSFARVNRDISLKENIDASRSIALGTLHLGMRCYLRRYI